MNEIVSLQINNERITANRGMTLIEIAREYGISIPTLCSIKGLTLVGSCRLCMVEIEGYNRLQTACSTPVEEGMVVQTQSPRVQKYRKMILELMLSEGNHVCSTCTSNGTCELQGLADQIGVEEVRFDYLHQAKPRDDTHKRFVRDQNRCILCTRCVRVCREIESVEALGVASKGLESEIITDLGEHWGDSATCTTCGKCIHICPTGALFEKEFPSGFSVATLDIRQSRKPQTPA
jgi:bidirectional [NiFe] hydrogenase diaphorase subunit